MRSSILFIAALILILNEISGQSRWVHQYLETYNAAGHNIQIAYDNGYLLTGRIIPNYQFTWLIKTDINGDVRWERKIMGNYNRINTDRISQNENGEIFLCGSVTLDGKTDALIMKLNACGEKEWCRTLMTTSNYDFYTDIVCTHDGGCAAVVINAFHPLFINSTGILRFSTDGDLVWQQYYQSQDPGIQEENIFNLLLTPDSGFLMTGYCYYPDPNNPGLSWLHPYFVKTDSLGNLEWEVVLHSETADMGGKAWQTILNPSGTYYYSCISHYYHFDTLYAKRSALVKIDLQGNVLGVYDLVNEDYKSGTLFSAAFINDSLLAGGTSWFYSEDEPQSRAVVFDTLGILKNSLTLLNTGWLAKTAVTHDGKLLFYNTIEEDGDFDTYLFKLTQDLEQDTFYTRPFVYDSLCPYQIVSDTIVPDDCGVIVGVEAGGQGGVEAWGRGGLEVWPVPCGEILNFKFSILNSERDYILSVYDVFGREVAEIKVPGKQDQVQINVESYPPGVYIAVLKSGGDYLGSGKFVVR
ncbi:MAG: T9SS type A sorting domain-containing protein [Bacteroidales bacterium]|nr:T9SS type A sorting domain-containing protein [Bacteroidales bacterium]